MIQASSDDEDIFDLNGVLMHPIADLKFHYILILEWLFESDERTGAVLHDWLLRKFSSDRVEYFPCRSRADLEARLGQARLDISTRGIPMVHIEAHGEHPLAGQISEGLVGPNGEGGRQLLPWEELGDALRPLNIASRFNLLVVAAACYGEGAMMGVRGGLPMPFVAVVGYDDSVSALSVKHSSIELYHSLLLDKTELGLAVEAADRQRHDHADAVLRPTSMAALLAESFIQGAADRIAAWRGPLSAGATASSGPRNPQTLQIVRDGVVGAWSDMWMMQQIPENAERFAVDANKLVERAEALAERRGNPI